MEKNRNFKNVFLCQLFLHVVPVNNLQNHWLYCIVDVLTDTLTLKKHSETISLVELTWHLETSARVSLVPPPAASGQISAVLVVRGGGGGKGKERGEWPNWEV